MKKIFVDVTQLMQWQGRLTGVPRVQHELISRFIKDENSVFVTWHGHDFCEIKAEAIFKDKATTQVEATAPRAQLSESVSLGVSRTKRLLGRSKYLKRIYHKVRAVRPPSPTIDAKIITTTPGDIFYIIEGIWSDENYIQKIIAFKNSGVKIVQTCYDMLPIVTPQFSGHSTDWLYNYVRKIYPICTLVLSISEHTKRDVKDWLISQKLPVPNIEVFRLGDNFESSVPTKPKHEDIANAPFILSVGTIEVRKNHALLYYMYKQAALKKIDLPRIIIVGRRGWKTENIFDLMTTDPDVKDKITILQNASDEELAWLYENCLFTMYPSFYEGWGLPIAESMYYGVPCLASNTSSMPEIAGDLISYFDPTSPDTALKEAMFLLKPKNLQEARVKAKKYKMTTWNESYRQVKEYIMEIA